MREEPQESRESTRNLISIDQAWRKIVAEISPMPQEILPLPEATGFIAARDIRSLCDSPPFSSSAMDGFAVCSADVKNASPRNPVRLEVKCTLPAGKETLQTIQRGEAARIFTGAPLPRGADAVVIQERTRVLNNHVFVETSVPKGANTRKQGEEAKRGIVLVKRGSFLSPPAVALLASQGILRIPVYRKPQVAFFTTGNELVHYESKPPPGKIRDSHSISLPLILRDTGIKVKVLKPCPDNINHLASKTRSALAASDVLIVSGGVSVGEYDFVKAALRKAGVKPVFWGVAMKPGKPFFFGKKGKKLIFGLPGNPSAAFVTMCRFVRPALRQMMGLSNYKPVTLKASLASSCYNRSRRTMLLRGKTKIRRRGEIIVDILPHQESHMLRAMAEADCIVILPPSPEEYRKGSRVGIQLLPWAWP